MIDEFEYNNEDENDMSQIHSIHVHMNAIAAIRRNISTGPSLTECDDCGEDIPETRRVAVQGCTRCIHCQTLFERNK